MTTNHPQNAEKPTSQDKTKSSSTKDTNRTERAWVLSWITFVLCPLTLGLAIFATYSTWQFRQLMTQNQNLIDASMAQLKTQQVQCETQTQNKLSTLASSQDSLQQAFNRINQQFQAVLKETAFHSEDWMLLKARYYLQLAQINAYWSDDLQSVDTLLNQADTLLASTHDQQLFPIRQAIAKERAEIKGINSIDLAGLLSELDAAQKSVATLPFYQLSDMKKEPSSTPGQTESMTWQNYWQNTVHHLQQLVIIRQHDSPVNPLLTAQQEILFREQVRFNLQEAQWALLHRNQPVFQIALNQAIDTIERLFNKQAKNTQALLNQLHQIKKINIETKKPKLDQSLNLLNQRIDEETSEHSSLPQSGASS